MTITPLHPLDARKRGASFASGSARARGRARRDEEQESRPPRSRSRRSCRDRCHRHHRPRQDLRRSHRFRRCYCCCHWCCYHSERGRRPRPRMFPRCTPLHPAPRDGCTCPSPRRTRPPHGTRPTPDISTERPRRRRQEGTCPPAYTRRRHRKPRYLASWGWCKRPSPRRTPPPRGTSSAPCTPPRQSRRKPPPDRHRPGCRRCCRCTQSRLASTGSSTSR